MTFLRLLSPFFFPFLINFFNVTQVVIFHKIMEPKMAIIQNKLGKRITIIIETFLYIFFTIDSKEY
jgi:hypothetical protein